MKNKIKEYLDGNLQNNRHPKNQGELAKMVGVRREYINRIINDKITPTMPLGIMIARALKTSAERVFIVA